MTDRFITRPFGVLAYAIPNDAARSPLFMSVVIKCNKQPAQFTLSLQSSLPVSGINKPQTITLQYDGDNIASCSLGSVSMTLTQAQLEQITTSDNPRIHTLILKLANTCQVWHLPTASEPACLVPQSGHEAHFDQLSSLVRAKELHIILDYYWLRPENRDMFKCLIKYPENLSAFPPDRNFTTRYKLADWTVFVPPGHVGTDTGADPVADEDLLPSYNKAWVNLQKRSK